MKSIEAVYQNQVFKPLQAVDLAENQRVRLSIQPVEASDAQGGESSVIDAFLRGVGSVLEFYPSPERFNPYRLTREIPLDEWPMAVRRLLAELHADASEPEAGS